LNTVLIEIFLYSYQYFSVISVYALLRQASGILPGKT